MTEQSLPTDGDGMAPVGTLTEAGLNGMDPDQAGAIAEARDTPEPTEGDVPEAPASGSGDVAADDGTAFLAELTRSMQAAAGAERKRVEDDTERRRNAHLETIAARRESEVSKMRELAAEDLKAIDDWAESERQRIGRERDEKAAALQEDLETSLTEHGATIDREIAGVEAAVAAYRAETDAFFAGLDTETDPVEIARQAGRRPRFPDLATIPPAEAASQEPPAVGVMESPADADPADAWARWNEASTEAVAETTAAPEGTPGEDSPIPETAGAEAVATVQPSGGSLLQSVTTYRPFARVSGQRREE
jgi:hypothetical protein